MKNKDSKMLTELLECSEMIKLAEEKHEKILERQFNSMKSYIMFLISLLVFTWISLWLVILISIVG